LPRELEALSSIPRTTKKQRKKKIKKLGREGNHINIIKAIYE
jgi:hypothetical protein